ncbi:MAG: RDD family protein [Candidatus Sericytochromatia bacterium]
MNRTWLPIRRIMASLLDALLLLQVLLAGLLLPEPPGLTPLLPLGFYGLIGWIWLRTEVLTGQSVGKALMRLKIDYPAGRTWQLWFRALLRNLSKYLILVMTGWGAFELFPANELLQSLGLPGVMGLWLLWYGFLALLLNFWVLGPRMAQFPPGKCLHDWAAGTTVKADAFDGLGLGRRLGLALSAVGLLLTGIYFCFTLVTGGLQTNAPTNSQGQEGLPERPTEPAIDS